MWHVIEHLSWIAGIIGAIAAVVGAPALLKAAKGSGRMAGWLWLTALFLWAILILFRWEPALKLIETSFRAIASGLVHLHLSESASWTCTFFLLGLALGVSLLPLKIAAFETVRIMAKLEPIMHRQRKQYANDPPRSMRETQKLQHEFNARPTLVLAAYGGSLLVGAAALLILPHFAKWVSSNFGTFDVGWVWLWILAVTSLGLRVWHVSIWNSQTNHPDSVISGAATWAVNGIQLAVVGVILHEGEGRALLGMIAYYLAVNIRLFVARQSPCQLDQAKMVKWTAG